MATQAPLNGSETPFRLVEKSFSKKDLSRTLSDVFDPEVQLEGSGSGGGFKLGNGWAGGGQIKGLDVQRIPLSNGDQRPAFIFPSIPGLVMLPGYVNNSDQKILIQECLSEHLRPPNANNLASHYVLPPNGLWSAYSKFITTGEETPVPTLTGSRDAAELERLAQEEKERASKEERGRKLIENKPAEVEGYEALKKFVAELPAIKPTGRKLPISIVKAMRDLRWCNIGILYNWLYKQYDFNESYPFPPSLATRCIEVVKSIPWANVYASPTALKLDDGTDIDWEQWDKDYSPDAGIINYYQPNDRLMAHVDRSELDPNRPLVSVSLGLSAIFLIGSDTRHSEPLPILMRSGDVLIMSGRCRRAYHGIPRVLDGTLPDHLKFHTRTDDGGWKVYETFLETTRININARQVFPPGFERPEEQPLVAETV